MGIPPNQQIPVTSNIHHDCHLHNQQLNGQFTKLIDQIGH